MLVNKNAWVSCRLSSKSQHSCSQIPQDHSTTHTRPTAHCRTPRRNQKNVKPTAATLHEKTMFRAPASSQHKAHATLTQALPCDLHHFSTSPLPYKASLPKVTASRSHRFPKSPLPQITSPSHHFPRSPLPQVTTSLGHHFTKSPLSKVTTSLKVSKSSLPQVITSLGHGFPKSSLPQVTMRGMVTFKAPGSS